MLSNKSIFNELPKNKKNESKQKVSFIINMIMKDSMIEMYNITVKNRFENSDKILIFIWSYNVF